jgi:hypothetical protein
MTAASFDEIEQILINTGTVIRPPLPVRSCMAKAIAINESVAGTTLAGDQRQ